MHKSIFGKETPEWFLKSSIYQINPRTFSENGTLTDIREELPFLRDLGFKIIYLCPIFEADDTNEGWSPRQKASGTNNPKNPYRMNDFFKIDEEYGSMSDLALLISEAHTLGLKVILDLVYLHIGPRADIFKTHPEFAMHDENGNIINTRWNFPQLNYECQGLREYLWCNMAYYIGILDADGFRCDVGDEVPLDFWQEGKLRIRAIKPEAIMINEGIRVDYLVDCFDADYAFCWHEAIYKVLEGSKGAKHIQDEYSSVAGNSKEGKVFLRDMDNHDTVTDWPRRVEELAGHEGMEMVLALNYTIDGIPMVYTGNELGDTTKLSMFANRFHMGKFKTTDRSIKNESFSLRRQAVIKQLNRLKAESDLLAYGDTYFLNNSSPDSIFTFLRKNGNEEIIFIGNLSPSPVTVKIDLPSPERLYLGDKLLESESAISVSPNGEVKLSRYAYICIKL